MRELERITDQLRRAYAGTAWHGPSVVESLEGVTHEIAVRRPIRNAHSIWELVHHIGAWADIPRRRILGEKFDVTNDLNFPPVPNPADEASWQDSLANLEQSQNKLLGLIVKLSDERLDQPIMPNGPTLYVLLHGIAQHHVYHAGQIVLLKKE